jgi:hypothetical protein
VYDSVFMSLYKIYVTSGFQLRQDFISGSPTANMLGHFFESLLDSPSCTTTCTMFDYYRDKLCDELSSKYPEQFPCFGQHGAAVSAILDVPLPFSGHKLIAIPSCSNRCNLNLSTNLEADAGILNTVVPSELRHNSAATTSIPVNLNRYVSDFLHRTSQDPSLRPIHASASCAECEMGLMTFSSTFVNAPPVLFLEVPMEAGSSLSEVHPSWYIEVPSPSLRNVYRLSAVVYLGGFHFTYRLISENGSVWKYDGQINNVVPIFEFSAQPERSESEILQFLSLDSRKAHIYVYSIMPTA